MDNVVSYVYEYMDNVVSYRCRLSFLNFDVLLIIVVAVVVCVYVDIVSYQR